MPQQRESRASKSYTRVWANVDYPIPEHSTILPTPSFIMQLLTDQDKCIHRAMHYRRER